MNKIQAGIARIQNELPKLVDKFLPCIKMPMAPARVLEAFQRQELTSKAAQNKIEATIKIKRECLLNTQLLRLMLKMEQVAFVALTPLAAVQFTAGALLGMPYLWLPVTVTLICVVATLIITPQVEKITEEIEKLKGEIASAKLCLAKVAPNSPLLKQREIESLSKLFLADLRKLSLEARRNLANGFKYLGEQLQPQAA